MLGLKIAATGAIVLLGAGLFIRGEWPATRTAAVLLAAWLAGAVTLVVGLLMAVWG